MKLPATWNHAGSRLHAAPRRRIVTWALTAALVAAGATDALAQRPQRYQPSRPTVTPYLNLLRNNNSPLPNYYSLVRPQFNQQALNQQQQTVLLNQQRQIQGLQAGLLRGPQSQGPVTGNASWFMNPGSRSTFLNTSRYYSRSAGGAATLRY